jgi:hypothetical protein
MPSKYGVPCYFPVVRYDDDKKKETILGLFPFLNPMISNQVRCLTASYKKAPQATDTAIRSSKHRKLLFVYNFFRDGLTPRSSDL